MKLQRNSRPTRTAAQLAGVISVVAAIAGSAHLRSIAQEIPFPIPPSGTDHKGWVSTGNAYRMIIRDQSDSMLLAQVIAVQPSPSAKSSDSGSWGEVSGGSLQVLETLAGVDVRGVLAISNPPAEPPKIIESGPGPASIQVMRKGELWIVFYNSRTKEVNKWSSFWLTGPNDPVLAQFRVHQAWMNRRDSAAAMSEMETAVGNPVHTPGERFAALLTLQLYAEQGANSIQLDPRKKERYKQAVTDLLANPALPAALKSRLIQMTTIDLTHELAPDSYDTLQLHALLNIVLNNQNEQVVDDAAARLFFVMVQQPSPANTHNIYFSPQIIAALEQRAASDAAQGKASFVSRTLSNLDLIKQRSLQQIKQYNDMKQTTIVVRNVPPVSNSAISQKILTATQK